MQASLVLLERSRICRSVAQLRGHPDPHLADLASQLTKVWRTRAEVALRFATQTLTNLSGRNALP